MGLVVYPVIPANQEFCSNARNQTCNFQVFLLPYSGLFFVLFFSIPFGSKHSLDTECVFCCIKESVIILKCSGDKSCCDLLQLA